MDIPWKHFLHAEVKKIEELGERLPSKIENAKKVIDAWENNANLIPAFLEDEGEKPVQQLRKLEKFRLSILSMAAVYQFENMNCRQEQFVPLMQITEHLLKCGVSCLGFIHDSNHQAGRRLTQCLSDSIESIIKLGESDYSFQDVEEANWASLTSAIVLSWLEQKTLSFTSEIRKLFLNLIVMPRIPLNKATSIPTDVSLQFELCCHKWLAQTLEYKDTELNSENYPSFRRFNSKRLGEVKRGRKQFYRGLKVGDIYLSVLLEQLQHVSTPIHSKENYDSMPPSPPLSLPQELVSEISIGQWPSVDLAINPKIQFKTYFATGSETTTSQKISAAPAYALDPSILNIKPFFDNESCSVGSIEIDAANFIPDGDFFWIDLVVTIKGKDGIWHVIPIELEELDGEEHRLELIVDETCSKDLTEKMREALDRSCWAYQLVPPGIFLACAIE